MCLTFPPPGKGALVAANITCEKERENGRKNSRLVSRRAQKINLKSALLASSWWLRAKWASWGSLNGLLSFPSLCRQQCQSVIGKLLNHLVTSSWTDIRAWNGAAAADYLVHLSFENTFFPWTSYEFWSCIVAQSCFDTHWQQGRSQKQPITASSGGRRKRNEARKESAGTFQ